MNASIHIATADLIEAPEDMSYWDAPSWREAAIEYHRDRPRGPAIEPERLALLRRLMENDVSLERAWHELNDNRPPLQNIIEAICYAVRKRGLAALKEPATIERLSRCDDAAQAEIRARIARQYHDERKT